jgi:urease gamma subunit
LVSIAAMVAERRLKRGVKLNYPEAVALINSHQQPYAQNSVQCAAAAGCSSGNRSPQPNSFCR